LTAQTGLPYKVVVHTDHDDDAPLDAATALELLQSQRRSVEQQMGSFVPVITATWGVVWLVGFGALWAIDGARPVLALPLAVAVTVFVVAMLVGVAVSAWFGIRSSRGIRSNPATAFTGALYGVTWMIGAVGIAVLGTALRSRGMTPELANFYYPSAYVLLVGVLYLVAGAIWRSVPSAVGGGALVVIAAVAPFLPYPAHYAFFAIAGGGAFLLLALASRLQLLRATAAARSAGARG